MKALVLALVCLATWSSTVYPAAEPDDYPPVPYASSAAALLKACKQVDTPTGGGFEAGWCLGLINATGALLRLNADTADYNGRIAACIPVEASVGQQAKVVAKFLEEHPKELHESAVMMAAVALVVAWPCED